MKVYVLFFVLSTFFCSLFSQNLPWSEDFLRKKNNIIYSLEGYHKTILGHASKKLIPLKNLGNAVKFEVRYETPNNFLHKVLYKKPEIVVRKVVYDSLVKVLRELKKHNLGIKIFDAYRPYSVTIEMFKLYPDSDYVATPYKGSKHNRGCALDMTLYDLTTGKDLIMPTDYDFFGKDAWPKTKIKNKEATKNRDFMIAIMRKYGFKVSVTEWWHYDYMKYKKYELLDLSFDEVRQIIY